MVADIKAPAFQFLFQETQGILLHLNYCSAFTAQEMMVKMTIILTKLVAVLPLVKTDFMHDPQASQQFEGSIHGGYPDPRVALFYLIINILSRHVSTPGVLEYIKNRLALRG